MWLERTNLVFDGKTLKLLVDDTFLIDALRDESQSASSLLLEPKLVTHHGQFVVEGVYSVVELRAILHSTHPLA